jgi:SOS-response transcriptional repressor LexA
VALPDDAMAPRAPAGTLVKFDSTRQANPGDGILVVASTGQIAFREYRLRLGGAWEGHATNPAYPSLLSTTDALKIIAVFIGIDSSWAALTR